MTSRQSKVEQSVESAKKEPSVRIWIPDKEIAPEAHDVLKRAAMTPRLQEGFKRMAREFDLDSLDVTIRKNDDHEDGVPECRIVLVFGQTRGESFDKGELIQQAEDLLGIQPSRSLDDLEVTYRGIPKYTPEKRQAVVSEYAQKYGSICAFDSHPEQQRSGAVR